MGGGLMQLVAYGAQDIYLTGNPQITFFKVVYRRHTNFSMESIEQTINGTISTNESTVDAIISRNGDLVTNLHLDVNMKNMTPTYTTGGSYVNWVNNTGHALLKQCEIEIGGQRIDRHYGQWLDIWNELTDHDDNEKSLLNKHSAKNTYLKSVSAPTSTNATTTLGTKLYIPLKFWFCRNPGLALPLIALQYHEVKVKMTLRATAALVNTDVTTTAESHTAPTVKLYADYIYLDTDERRRFAQVSHEYLIEQLQKVDNTMKQLVKLNLNHPVKELIWVVQDNDVTTEATTGVRDATANVQGTIANNNDYFNYMANTSTNTEYLNGAASFEHFGKAKLMLNGHDRFSQRDASYFRTVQPLQAGHKVPEKHIYVYSFALKPEEHQPSGTCNFSRIDNAQLEFTSVADSSTSTITVYAVNYNVLRIMSGMGGLAYSN